MEITEDVFMEIENAMEEEDTSKDTTVNFFLDMVDMCGIIILTYTLIIQVESNIPGALPDLVDE